VPPENGITYTSVLPDSLDAYAIQWPSGEKRGAVARKLPWIRGTAFRGSARDKIHIWPVATISPTRNNSDLPSGDQSAITRLLSFPSSSNSSSPPPFVSFRKIALALLGESRTPTYAIHCPFGDHAGEELAPAP